MGFPKLICFSFLVGLTIPRTYCGTLPEANNLISDIFANYSADLRPSYYQNETLYVNVGFYLFSIYQFDELDGTISLVACPILYWQDYRLTWDPSSYGGIEELTLPKEKFWMPDIFLVNPGDKMEALGTEDFIGRMSYYGTVTWLPGSIIKVTCEVDMTYFPFDTQTCAVILSAWGYNPNEVTLLPAGSVDFTYYKSNQMWTVKSSKLERYGLDDYNGLVQAEITLKRKPLYSGLNIIAPIFLLCILNPLVFILPVESGERVSYAVTIFLSFAVFMTLISDTMPKVSEPMSRLSFLIFTSMAYSTVLCIVTILTMRLYYKNEKSKIPVWMRNLYRYAKCERGCRCRIKRRKVNDAGVENADRAKDIVKDIKVSEISDYGYPEEAYVEAVCHHAEKLTWRKIALAFDKVAFIGSAIFVIFFSILTIGLLAAQ